MNVTPWAVRSLPMNRAGDQHAVAVGHRSQPLAGSTPSRQVRPQELGQLSGETVTHTSAAASSSSLIPGSAGCAIDPPQVLPARGRG